MSLPTYPAVTFRNMGKRPIAPWGAGDDFARDHPFAPGGWNPAANPAELDPNAAAMTDTGRANARANAGIYDAGTHGAINAQANGTGVVAPRFVDPVGGAGIQANPAYPVAPDPIYRGVNGVGTPGPLAPVAPASAVLRQGQPVPVAPGRFDLRGGAGAAAPALGRDPEAMAMAAVFPSSGLPPVAPIGAGGAEFDRMMPLLSAAAGLDDAQAGNQAARNLTQLKRAGALPVAGEAPEISANKFGYLRSRLDASLAGGTPRAPGSPVYPGARPVAPGATAGAPVYRGGTVSMNTADAAAAYRGYQAIAGRPVTPGSAGYKTVDVPNVGTMVVDNATGQPISSGSFTRADKKTDEKTLTQTEVQQVNALQQSARDLKSLEDAFNEIGDEDFGGPVSGRLKGLDPTNVNISRLQNLVTAATPNLARGVFREVGVLTDQDVARYQKLLPNANDTAAQRKQKMGDLKTRLGATLEEQLSTLQAAGRDVSGLREKVLGDQKAAAKASGAPAVFKDPSDGQQYPVQEIKGRGRGVVKGGKFYPIIGQ